MAILIVVAILLTINMLLMHFDRLVNFYYDFYRLVKKSNFHIGESVFIDEEEYILISLCTYEKPYTYLCKKKFPKRYDYCINCHESKIVKKTGVLKELE